MPDRATLLALNAGGPEVENLHLSLRRLGADVPPHELDSRTFGHATMLAVRRVQERFRLPATGAVDAATAAAVNAAAAANAAEGNSVAGRVYLQDGRIGKGLAVRLYGRGFGGQATLLGEAQTDDQGFYSIPYQAGANAAGVELRTLDPAGREVALSSAKYDAEGNEVVNVVAPVAVKPLAPEFTRLAEAVAGEIEDIGRLADARETENQRDLTLLHEATTWDARVVGLAAHATRLSKDTELPTEALYGLFRAGLPTDPQKLAVVPSATVGKALEKAKKTGVIGLSDASIQEARSSFERFALESRRATTSAGTASTLGDMLEIAPIGAQEREAFEQVVFENPDQPDKVWEKAASAGVSDGAIEALRVQGKLAFLTLNNAPLTESLQGEVGSVDGLVQLVDMGLYEADAWKERVRQTSGGGANLDAAIPAVYAGQKPTERLDAYAADMARKVRLSFPTQVLGQRVASGELPIDGAVAKPVAAFLRQAPAEGYELGRTPVSGFLKEKGDMLLGGIAADRREQVIENVKTLDRLYQITPSDDALKKLLQLGFRSAYDVRKFDHVDFVDRFGPLFQPGEAELISRKSDQVAAVTYTFYGAAKQIDAAPPIFGTAPPQEEVDKAKDLLINQYPTLESLFGSLDFCECEHCRSVLSPAAYLVELLQFVNPDDLLWDSFKDGWKKTHNNQAYPFGRPYDVLKVRRPDLANVPLTCENTNTALPYIDVVNEILEHHIADGAPKAYDTGQATTPELLAEPQNVHVGAYDQLQKARYPIGLPFDLWTETVRAFFDHFQTPLWSVLRTFRPTEAVAAHVEQLGLTPEEFKLLTGSNLATNWFELYGFTAANAAKSDLTSAKRLSRRLGVTYKQLIELVTGPFVNPRLESLAVLRKLGIEVTDVFRYKGHAKYTAFTAAEKAGFEARLAALSADYPGFDAKKWLDKAYAKGDFNKVVVLHDTDPGCNFDKTILRYADGTAADPVLLLKLNVLVRLWRRLGWSLAETDRALAVFVPGGSAALTAAKLPGALRVALVYMAHLDELAERAPVGKGSRTKLLTLWSNLPTAGKNPLYAQLFLTRSVLKNDPGFDDPLGNYLSKPNVPLDKHLLGIQGALNVSAEDVERILADAGTTLANAKLTLETVSLLYRYVTLAKGLKLSVAELTALKALTGLDPFKPLVASPTLPGDDNPFNQTLAFVGVAEAVRGSDFSIEDLDYLLRHRADPVGKHRPDPTAALTLVRGFGAEVQRIRTEHAIPDDPAALTDEALRQKLALIYPTEVVDTFMAMWSGTRVYEAVERDVTAANALDPDDFRTELAIGVRYDAKTKVQQLLHRGVLLDARRTALKAAHPGAVFASLVDAVGAEARAFFDKELSDFLTAADYDSLFAPPPKPEPANAAEIAANQAADVAKRDRLAKAFLPHLQERLIRALAVQTLATELDAEPAIVETLLTNEAIVADPSAAGDPVLEAFAAAGERGLTVTGGAATRRIAGHVEVPASGRYTFFVELEKQNAEATLRFDHLPDPVLATKAAAGDHEVSVEVELTAGVPYGLELTAQALDGGDVRLRVKAERLPKGPLSPRLTVYPAAVVERVDRARSLLAKVIMLMEGFGLVDRELRHLVSHPADFGGLDLDTIPTQPDPDTAAAAAAAQARFDWFEQLLDYARLKEEIAAEAEDIVSVLERARRDHPETVSAADAKAEVMNDLCTRFGAIVRREPATVAATAAKLGIEATSEIAGGQRVTEVDDFATPGGLRRLWAALAVVELLGVQADAIERWCGVVSAAPAQQAEIARDLRNTAKARYEPETWQRVARPIFDVLRRRQRDALVAFVMEKNGFDRLEQLFEHFLVDPGMEPVVQTSRIQLAIASVQLFVQRCLLNLEPEVRAAAIVNAKHWDWMKRYRVWEANRKIFLYPENWLEPEFRDDKSHLFSELEGSLLQGDITDEAAENAFFTYLQGLDKIARLDVVSMYVEEMPDPVNNVLHVVARSHTHPYKYYYRRHAHQVWMPWEPIEAEIESDHIAVVVWRGRLHVFWATFMEMARHEPPAGTIGDVSGQSAASVPGKQIQVELNWTERFQDEWSTRETGARGATTYLSPGVSWDPSSVLIYVTKEARADGVEGAVRINLGGAANQSFRIVSKNAPPQTGGADPEPAHPYSPKSPDASRYLGRISLDVRYSKRREIEKGQVVASDYVTEPILGREGYFNILRPSKPISMPNGELDANDVAALVAPFFFIDQENTFYVEPELRQKTFEHWDTWVVQPQPKDPVVVDPGFLDEVDISVVIPEIEYPEFIEIFDPLDDPWEDLIDPASEFEIDFGVDWVTNPATLLEFDGSLLGQDGSVGAEILTGIGTVGLGEVTIPDGAGTNEVIVAGTRGVDEVVVTGTRGVNEVVITGTRGTNEVVVTGGTNEVVVTGTRGTNEVVIGTRGTDEVVVGTRTGGNVAVGGDIARDEVVVVTETARARGTIVDVAGTGRAAGRTGELAIVRGGGVNAAVLENLGAGRVGRAATSRIGGFR